MIRFHASGVATPAIRKTLRTLLAAACALAALWLLAGCEEDAEKESQAGSTGVQQPAINNLRDQGLVATGFVVGTGPSNATSIEYALDGGTYQTATGTASWKFPLPIGASIWLDGTQHTIAVRARKGSTTSGTVQMTVRKAVNKDLNGDGYPDLAVGAVSFGSGGGAVYVFHGASSGLADTASTSANASITGPALSELGTSAAIGDVDGDGYADLAVGASTNPGGSGNGAVYIFHGSASGVVSGDETDADTALTGTLHFGASVAFGDTNSDGYADLAVGSYGGASAAYVFHGSATGVSSGTSSSATKTITGATNSFFGSALALGDVNGDGHADLAVVAQSTGSAYAFHGSSTGVLNGAYTSADTTLTGIITSVAIGDVDEDGNADLAVGEPTTAANVGAAYVLLGSASGITGGAAAAVADTTLSGSATTFFGNALAIGDSNGDGYADLAVGASSSSKAFVFLGSSAGVATANSTAATTTISGGSGLGISLGFLDINGDGRHDLITGDDLTSSNGGAAYVFHGSATGVASKDFSLGGVPNATLTGPASGRFGTSVSQ